MPPTSSKFVAALLLAFGALTTSPAAAHYSEPCVVRVTVEYPGSVPGETYYRGQSPPLTARCNYLTGYELNARMGGKPFAERRVYVVIVWPTSRPSYIRLTQSLPFCGEVTEPGCADRISGRLVGRDDAHDARGRLVRRTWDICQPGVLDRDCYAAFGPWRP